VNPSDVVGTALLIKVNGVKEGVMTKHGGPKEMVEIDLCGVDSKKVALDQGWFNEALIDALRPYMGQVIAVKLAYHTGASGRPYIVAEGVTEEESKRAQALLDKENPFSDQTGQSNGNGSGPVAVAEPPLTAASSGPRW